jgi:hypothetical protein
MVGDATPTAIAMRARANAYAYLWRGRESVLNERGYWYVSNCALAATWLLTSAVADSASARQAPATDWSHGTTLNGFGGMTADSKPAGSVLGGAAG